MIKALQTMLSARCPETYVSFFTAYSFSFFLFLPQKPVDAQGELPRDGGAALGPGCGPSRGDLDGATGVSVSYLGNSGCRFPRISVGVGLSAVVGGSSLKYYCTESRNRHRRARASARIVIITESYFWGDIPGTKQLPARVLGSPCSAPCGQDLNICVPRRN